MSEQEEVTLDYQKLRKAIKQSWPGAFAGIVEGRKAVHYAFNGHGNPGTGVPGPVLRGVLKSLESCREVKVTLNGLLEFQYLNEGGMPGKLRMALSVPDLKRGRPSWKRRVAGFLTTREQERIRTMTASISVQEISR